MKNLLKIILYLILFITIVFGLTYCGIMLGANQLSDICFWNGCGYESFGGLGFVIGIIIGSLIIFGLNKFFKK
ncbi:MAG: hypothetical protein ABIJ23_05175 [Candidatus Magasanikbacteria bacterium]|nr:hypothetical protein [Patescibacteria group bacterium]